MATEEMEKMLLTKFHSSGNPLPQTLLQQATRRGGLVKIIKSAIGLAFFVLFVPIVVYLATREKPLYRQFSSNEEITTSAAWITSQSYIKAQLKAPSTAEFPYDYKVYHNGFTYTVIAEVDAQNSFGAKLRKTYTCRINYQGGDWTDLNNWKLLELTLAD